MVSARNNYGVTGNSGALARIFRQAVLIWFKCLNRRSQKSSLTKEQFIGRLLKRYSLPRAVAVHSILRVAKP